MPNRMRAQQEDLFDLDPSRLDEGDLKTGQTTAVVTGTDWTTDTILSQLRRQNINLTPRFQRREAWTDDRKSKFIESLFLGYPVPQLVLAETKQPKGKYIVIDGKQRLLSIRRFAATEQGDDFKPLKLSNLEFRTDLNGKSLEDLLNEARFKDDVNWYENQPIRTVVVRNWEQEDVLYRIFIRLNTGSLPLSTQELRQALHPGKFADFVDDFAATSDVLHEALGIDGPDFRMRDVEILVRFFAFSLFLAEYRGNLKAFLDDTCEKLNERWITDEESIRAEADRCVRTVQTTLSIFREDSFRRWNGKSFDGPFNRAVFDAMTYYLKNPDIAKKAVAQKDKIKEAFISVCADPSFLNSIQTTTKSLSATSLRLGVWGEALAKTLGTAIPTPQLKGKRIVLP